MKSFFNAPHRISKLLIGLLGSLLASAFFVFNRYHHYVNLIFIIASLVVFSIFMLIIETIDVITSRWFSIKLHMIILIIITFISYYFLLKYKMYNTPQWGVYTIITIMSLSTISLGLLLDHRPKLFKSASLLLIVIHLVFYSFQCGGGFKQEGVYSTIPQVIQDASTIEVEATYDYQIKDFVGSTVDLSWLIGNQEGKDYDSRDKMLGYGVDQIPISGRLFLPDAQELVPLVVIIHGNHMLPTPSYLGYDYLGEYLSARGIAVVSLDHRALNGYLNQNLKDDNAARAILLLESIAYLQDEYSDVISFENITLAGHSRGGESIVIASTFNQLEHYPDDESIIFNYDFDIENLLAIAPTYQQYSLRKYPTDVNYVAIHGSHDQDVRTFRAEYTYRRINVEEDYFKSILYVGNANHGQFNTTWGKYDTRLPNALNTNTANLIAPQDQQQLVNVLAYQLVTKDNLSLFFDIHSFSSQLPKTWLTQQSYHGSNHMIYDFETTTIYSSENLVDEVATMDNRDTQKSRLNNVLTLQVNPESILSFDINSNGDFLYFDIAHENDKLDVKVDIEYEDGSTRQVDLFTTEVLPPYPIVLSKWERVFNHHQESNILETIQVELLDKEIKSITFDFNDHNTIYLDNIYVGANP